jgi:hypothetical protein
LRRLVPLLVLLACVAPGAGAASRAADTSVYAGLGTWVDIFALQTWAQPETAVDGMAARGVRTLYLETGNSSQREALVRPAETGRFVDAAHAAGIRVVAWYLPSLADTRLDLRRVLAAVRFRTASGGRFDSFALDIEASTVRRVAVRDARLLDLSRRLRAAVGAAYPLGAIVPSSVGLQLHPTYWPRFPYRPLAQLYDVFLPMAYSTYHASGGAATFAYVTASIADVRAGVGDPAVPIHVIGGLSGGIGPANAAGFMRAVTACAPLGYSIYEFPTTRPAAWAALREGPETTGTTC